MLQYAAPAERFNFDKMRSCDVLGARCSPICSSDPLLMSVFNNRLFVLALCAVSDFDIRLQ